MARIRTIKPEFPQSESMGRVSRDARLLFVQMWTLADDSGRLRGNSRMLASLLFPYDEDARGLIDTWIDELYREGCIICYSGPCGGSYVQIANWLDHQKIDKPSKSKYPEPPDHQFENPRESSANPRECSGLDQGPRTKDQGKDQGEEGSAGGVCVAVSRTVKPKVVIQKPDDVDQVHWDDWMKARKAKRAGPLTETAWKRVVNEAEASGKSLPEVVRICAERGWAGFEADWLESQHGRAKAKEEWKAW